MNEMGIDKKIGARLGAYIKIVPLFFFSLYSQEPCEAVHELAGFTEWPGSIVEVLPTGIQDTTDEEGFFHIHYLCAGDYRVRVWLEGHVVLETKVRLPLEAPLTLRGKGSFHQVVIEAQRGEAVRIDPFHHSEGEKGLAAQLVQVPGITLSRAGPLINKPLIEGLRGTRIAYWQGGQPFASQQWGEDHAPEIDPFSAEEIQVELGPSPIRHGTEAVGGAIVLPLPSVCCLQKGEGRLLLSGMTNGRGGNLSLRWQSTVRGWGYRLQTTLLRLGTLHTPHYYLTGTGTEQAHASFALHRLWSRWQFRVFYAQFNAQIGLFQGMHTGNLSDLERAIRAPFPPVPSTFSYRREPPYQNVIHELVSLNISYLSPNQGVWTLLFGRQFNRRREYDLVGLYTSREGVALDLQLTTYFLQMTYERGPWTGGIFLQTQRNYRQYAYFIPSYQRYQAGGYCLYRWQRWETGLRFEPLFYHFYRVIPQSGGQPLPQVQRSFLPLAFELKYIAKWCLQTAFLMRPPNPAELYAYGYHQAHAAFYIGGNTFRAEPIWSLRLSWEDKRLAGAIGAYFSPAFIWERIGMPVLSLRGAALSLNFHQSPATWVSLSGRWIEAITPSIVWELRGAYVWGNVYSTRPLPFPLLPPLVLTPTLRFQRSSWECELSWYYQGRQHRYSLTSEYLPPPPAYGLLGASFSYRLKGWKIIVGGENLLNRSYRAYPDLMRFFADQMGRQVKATLMVSI
ncbi:MAG: hypothetical protein RMK19_07915 [Bacteroidia bacterium]|nr:hypothetical protein [Bacteroidia bacterium]MDW8015921.1 hypothetical protein [Bacteroidia bacterium]